MKPTIDFYTTLLEKAKPNEKGCLNVNINEVLDALEKNGYKRYKTKLGETLSKKELTAEELAEIFEQEDIVVDACVKEVTKTIDSHIIEKMKKMKI